MSQLILEAFQELQGLEDEFTYDKNGVLKLQDFMENDEKHDDVSLIDPEADSEDEIKPSYIGNVVLKCCVCNGIMVKDPKNVIIDKTVNRANVEEECPYCLSTGGYKVVAQISDIEEDKDEEFKSDSEEVVEDEYIEESLTEAKEDEDDDLWTHVYDDLIKASGKKINKRGGERLQPSAHDYKAEGQIFSHRDGILFIAASEDQLKRPIEIAKKYGLDYRVKPDNNYSISITEKDKQSGQLINKKIPSTHSMVIVIPEELLESKLVEEVEKPITLEIELIEEDIKDFDDATGNLELYIDSKLEPEIKDRIRDASYIKISFFDSEVPSQLYKLKEFSEDILKLDWVEELKEELNESFESIELKTQTDQEIEVKSDDKGKIKIEIDSSKAESNIEESTEEVEVVDYEAPEEIIAPLADELKAEIKSNIEEMEEEKSTEEPIEIEDTEVEATEETQAEVEDSGVEEEIEEFDEEEFDKLSETYLKEVYDNVKSYKTINGGIAGGQCLILEGIIEFNSGKSVKTNFLFEGSHVTKRGKYKLIGGNKQITNKNKSFILTGDIKNKKLIIESLTYNYNAKDADGNIKRIYGTCKNK